MQKIPYTKTEWIDHILDIENNEVIQEGTKFTASRANNIEDGIFNAYEQLKAYYDEINKLRIQMEMIGRVPINNGTFFDPIDEEGNTKSLSLLRQSAVSQQALVIGATEIEVHDGTLFVVGQEVTVFDENNYENKTITNIIENKLTVSALEKSFSKGAFVVRSNAVIKDNKLQYGQWGNYSITISEVI